MVLSRNLEIPVKGKSKVIESGTIRWVWFPISVS